MPLGVEWSGASERDLRHVDPRLRERIRQAVYLLAETDQGDVKRLAGRVREWRLRVGDWRVIYTLRDTPTGEVIFVLFASRRATVPTGTANTRAHLQAHNQSRMRGTVSIAW